MYVNNPEYLKNAVCVTRDMCKYLQGKGFIVLGRINENYYFSKTPELEQSMKNVPIWLKIKIWMK